MEENFSGQNEMAAFSPEYSTIRTPEALSNLALLLSLLERVEKGETSKKLKFSLTKVLRRLGRDSSLAEQILSDTVLRQRLIASMRNSLEKWAEKHQDELDQTVELLSPEEAHDLLEEHYGDTALASKYQASDIYNDVTSIRATEQYYDLPVTGKIEDLLANYEQKYFEKLPLNRIRMSPLILLRKAVREGNLPQIRQLISKGTPPTPVAPLFRKIIREEGLSPRVKAILDELFKTKDVEYRQQLAKELTEIALELNSNDLLVYLQPYGVGAKDLLSYALHHGDIPLLQQALDEGVDLDETLRMTLTKSRVRKVDEIMNFLLERGADPVNVLQIAKPEQRLTLLRFIDPGFVPSPIVLGKLQTYSRPDRKLRTLTDILELQVPFPETILKAISQKGFDINIETALMNGDQSYISNILERLGSDAIDMMQVIKMAKVISPAILSMLIPLIPALDKARQKRLLKRVATHRIPALFELLLQNPHNNFAGNFPKLIQKLRTEYLT